VAGALQDHKRAIVIGKNSFGKGSVQTVLPLSEKEALKLTTALYYTPAGRVIQGNGITPDIMVENLKLAKEDASAILFEPLKEFQLKGYIEAGKKNDAKKKMTGEEQKKLARKDFQLYQALNVLKAMHQINEKLLAGMKARD
jgi:carboxyl-terminal processing protease